MAGRWSWGARPPGWPRLAVLAVLAALTQEVLGSPCRPRRSGAFSRPPTKTASLPPVAVLAALAILAALTQETLRSPCRPRRLKRFQDRQPRPPAYSPVAALAILAPLPWPVASSGCATMPLLQVLPVASRDLAGGGQRLRVCADCRDPPICGRSRRSLIRGPAGTPQGSTRTPLDPATGPRRTRYRGHAAGGAALHPSWRICAPRLANLVSV
jgi:hypothetical protein